MIVLPLTSMPRAPAGIVTRAGRPDRAMRWPSMTTMPFSMTVGARRLAPS